MASNSTADNAHIIAAEIEALRGRLMELEALEQSTQNTQPKPKPKEALLERWERARETHGTRTERQLWKQEERRRREALLLDNTAYLGGRKWLRKVEDEAQRKMSEDVKYNMRLLRLRMDWERKNAFHHSQIKGRPDEHGDAGLESDESDFLSDYSDATEEHAVRRQLIQKNWEFERQALELEYRMKVAKRARKKERERAFQQELAHQREPPEEWKWKGENPGMLRDASPVRPSLRMPRPSPPRRRDFIYSSHDSELHPISLDPGDVDNARDERGKGEYMPPFLNRVEWAMFRNHSARAAWDGKFPALDILIGDPVIDFDVPQKYRIGPGDDRLGKKPLDILKWPTSDEASAIRAAPPLPERVRINSTQILSLLDRVHAGPLTGDGRISSLVLLRPFRILIHYDEAIKSQVEEFENDFTKHGALKPAVGPDSSPADPNQGAAGHGIVPPVPAH